MPPQYPSLLTELALRAGWSGWVLPSLEGPLPPRQGLTAVHSPRAMSCHEAALAPWCSLLFSA